MPHQEEGSFGQIRITGVDTYFGTTSATITVKVLMLDAVGDVLMCTGTAAGPTDDLAGFAKGCIYIDTDPTDGTSGSYVNIGTNLLCEFNLIPLTGHTH
jgi:hypothetical protein